jgi:hypothetical protein
MLKIIVSYIDIDTDFISSKAQWIKHLLLEKSMEGS